MRCLKNLRGSAICGSRRRGRNPRLHLVSLHQEEHGAVAQRPPVVWDGVALDCATRGVERRPDDSPPCVRPHGSRRACCLLWLVQPPARARALSSSVEFDARPEQRGRSSERSRGRQRLRAGLHPQSGLDPSLCLPCRPQVLRLVQILRTAHAARDPKTLPRGARGCQPPGFGAVERQTSQAFVPASLQSPGFPRPSSTASAPQTRSGRARPTRRATGIVTPAAAPPLRLRV